MVSIYGYNMISNIFIYNREGYLSVVKFGKFRSNITIKYFSFFFFFKLHHMLKPTSREII